MAISCGALFEHWDLYGGEATHAIPPKVSCWARVATRASAAKGVPPQLPDVAASRGHPGHARGPRLRATVARQPTWAARTPRQRAELPELLASPPARAASAHSLFVLQEGATTEKRHAQPRAQGGSGLRARRPQGRCSSSLRAVAPDPASPSTPTNPYRRWHCAGGSPLGCRAPRPSRRAVAGQGRSGGGPRTARGPRG